MKKLILIGFTVSTLSLGLISCGTLGNASRTSTAVVGTGVGYVTTTGATVGRTVVTGADTLVGHVATQNDVVVYRKHGVVYRNGHAYHIQNGRYIIVR